MLSETCYNYCYEQNKNNYVAFFSSNEKKWINKIYALAKQYPDECIIIAEPQNNDGTIYCKLPQKWLAIHIPRKLNLTDEQREARRKAFDLVRK